MRKYVCQRRTGESRCSIGLEFNFVNEYNCDNVVSSFIYVEANGIRGGAMCDICGEEKQERTVSAQKVMKIPAMMNTIEAEAFMATAAEQINVPAGTASIGDGAFANCDDLLLVVIPGSGTTLTGNPFSGSDVAVICPADSAAATWCDTHGIPHNP